MRTTQQFSITLPNEMADIVKRKVAAGEYATESEVIRDGLRVLMARDSAVENWRNQQVGVATCNQKPTNLQSAHFSTRIKCN